MAAAMIKVDTKELRKAANAFENTGDKIKDLTTKMTNTVKELTGNVWSGDAANAYTKKFDGLQNDIQKMTKMIKEHVTDLETIAKEYETSEQQNIAVAKALSADVIV